MKKTIVSFYATSLGQQITMFYQVFELMHWNSGHLMPLTIRLQSHDRASRLYVLLLACLLSSSQLIN